MDNNESKNNINLNLLISSVQATISHIVLLLVARYKGLVERVTSIIIFAYFILIQLHFLNSSFTYYVMQYTYVYASINLIVYVSLFSIFLMHIGKSFTYAEYTITLQLLTYGFVYVLYATRSMNDISSYHFHFSYCSFLVLGTLMLAHFVANNALIPMKKFIYLIMASLLSLNLLKHFNHIVDSIIHIILDILPWKLVTFWIISFLLFTYIWWVSIGISKDIVIKRKSFHFLSLFIFIPGILYYPNFMGPAYGIALLLFIIVEYIRYQRIFGIKFSNFLNRYLKYVTNKKDQSGPIVMSHFYLLLGCAIPFLFKSNHQSTLKLLSGTIILGIGDTLACLIGVNYGKLKFEYNGKSVEGTVSGIVGSILLFIVIVGVKETLQFALIPIVLSFIFEAITDHLDNLFLPIINFAMINLFELQH